MMWLFRRRPLRHEESVEPLSCWAYCGICTTAWPCAKAGQEEPRRARATPDKETQR